MEKRFIANIEEVDIDEVAIARAKIIIGEPQGATYRDIVSMKECSIVGLYLTQESDLSQLWKPPTVCSYGCVESLLVGGAE